MFLWRQHHQVSAPDHNHHNHHHADNRGLHHGKEPEGAHPQKAESMGTVQVLPRIDSSVSSPSYAAQERPDFDSPGYEHSEITKCPPARLVQSKEQ